MPIKLLIAFIIGIIFAQWLIPLGDGLINLLLQWLEYIKSPLVIKIQEDTNKLELLKNELGEEPVNQIGFIIPNETEEDDEDDEI